MIIKQFIDTFQDKVVSADEALSLLDKVIIFGAGNGGRYAKSYLEMEKKEVLFFCDNDPRKHGTFIGSVKVLAPQKLLTTHDNCYVCIASDWAGEIARQLKEMGIKKYFDLSSITIEAERWKGHFNPNRILSHLEEIENVYNLLEDEKSKETLLSIIKYRLTLDPACLEISPFEAYYNPWVSPETGDAIVDGGAWAGDTALSFANSLDMKCKIFSFEPEARNYNSLLKTIEEKRLDDIVIPVKAGLWKDNDHLFLYTSLENSMQYYISSTGDEKIELFSLDNFLRERGLKVNLIKMDIEGAEIEAIAGAKETIGLYSPKLQITIYHKINDLWKIPLLIRDINPAYKFYLGHHSQNLFETVLYATTGDNNQ